MPAAHTPSRSRSLITQPQDKLERRKRAVIEMHVRGALPSQIAKHFEVDYSAVRAFLQRHQDEIEKLQDQLADALNNLWITDKRERVAVYQDMADGVMRWVDKNGITIKTYRYNALGLPYEYDERFDPQPANALQKVMRATAEELGQLPKEQTQVNVGVFIRQVAGFDGEIG